MAQKQQSKWRFAPKKSFSSKALSRRMKKVEGATVKHARRFVISRWKNVREVRRHVGLWALAVGLLIGAAGLQIFWYQQSYRVMAGAENGTYVEGVMGPVNTLNPIFASTSAEESASSLIFSRLLRHDTSGKLNYDLAESMRLSEDSRTYTIDLRDDAKWHDGVSVRARDVAFTVNLLKDASTRSTVSGWGDIVVKAEDENTVSFRLPSVYAAFPHALNYLPILPEHLLRDVEPAELREHRFSQQPVGSGPFRFRFKQDLDIDSGRKIIYLARNDSYYKGRAKLDRFQLHVYDTADAIVRGLNTSEVNAATDLALSDLERINTNRYQVSSEPINNGVYAIFNTTKGVLEDEKIRRALQVGTDTSSVRSSVGDDLVALDLPFLRDQVDAELPTAPEYNVKRAAELLDEAGWKVDGGVRKKDGEPLKLNFVTSKNSDLEKALRSLTDQWQKLGIVVTTSIVDPSDPSQNVVQNILQPRNYDVLLYRLAIGGDPDVYAYWHSSQATRGLNFATYSNQAADDALASARTVTDKKLRDAKYATFAKQWMSDAPAIGLFQTTTQYVYSPAVHSTDADKTYVTPTDRYADVIYWTVGDAIVHRTP
ncbi:hypothetical protein B7Y94_02495 [Candidatus Saccharibacteria bacterium 32-49-12]|nr:MAG: hypothetical protein B7Y94_02495 [Candidatus Saccharibacteria bacterium 32-49-12]